MTSENKRYIQKKIQDIVYNYLFFHSSAKISEIDARKNAQTIATGTIQCVELAEETYK